MGIARFSAISRKVWPVQNELLWVYPSAASVINTENRVYVRLIYRERSGLNHSEGKRKLCGESSDPQIGAVSSLVRREVPGADNHATLPRPGS